MTGLLIKLNTKLASNTPVFFYEIPKLTTVLAH